MCTHRIGISLEGSVTQDIILEDTAGWDCTLVANTTNGGPAVQVTGAAATNINWVAKIEMINVPW